MTRLTLSYAVVDVQQNITRDVQQNITRKGLISFDQNVTLAATFL